ncbi:hypothetical protein [Streptomyces sp. 4N124]|uniref:hypothetical protein n=1 Tax=Streptomyces sp. 4N124 TaxID=3457420 RepID=UPI003FD1509A
MIDYCAHVLSIAATVETLDSVAPSSEHGETWSETKQALQEESGYALLGALFDHLLERTTEGESEHEILEEAASIYALAIEAMAKMDTFRAEFEAMAKSPASATPQQFTNLLVRMKSLKSFMEGQVDRVKALKSKATPPYSHVPGHRATFDQTVSDWAWRDVVLGRRTDALVRELAAAEDGTSATRAFSFGALTSYSSNCIGSSYLATAVGGPRRSHPLRDRIARYAVGGWLRVKTKDAAIWPTFSTLRESLAALGGPNRQLPDAITNQISTALSKAFPSGSGAPAAPPDLQAGYERLLRHLELLDSFPEAPTPPDIDGDLLVRTLDGSLNDGVLGPGASGDPLHDPDTGPPVNDPNLGPPTPGGVPAVQGQVSDNGCFGLGLLILCLGIVAVVITIFILTSDDEDEQGNPTVTMEALTAFLESDDACRVVANTYNARVYLHEIASICLQSFKRIGLLYPEEADLGNWRFAQFTELPAEPGLAHPHRPSSDESAEYLLWPTSPIEEPTTNPSHYPPSSTPDVFLSGIPNAASPTVGEFGAEVWLRHQDGAVPQDSDINLNADADRGYAAACWRVAPGQSINHDPIPVETLGYLDVT